MSSSIASSATSVSVSSVQKLTVTFRKGESARFLSHLDLTAMLEYTVRRARLPVALSEGFSPRPRLSVAASLALGYVGNAEILEIVLREPVDPGSAAERLAAVLPPGVDIVDVRETPVGEKSAASRLASAVYRMDLREPVSDLEERISALVRCRDLHWDETRDGRRRERDLRPMLLWMDAIGTEAVRLEVRMDGDGSARPEHFLAFMEIPSEGVRIVRERIVLTPP